MDRTAIEDLFAFTDFSWRIHAETVRGLGGDALVEPAPGSGWPALRDAFGHMNWAYERWLADPAGTTAAPFDVEAIRSWDDLESYRRRVRGRCREYLDSLSDSHPRARAPARTRASRGYQHPAVPDGVGGAAGGVPVLHTGSTRVVGTSRFQAAGPAVIIDSIAG